MFLQTAPTPQPAQDTEKFNRLNLPQAVGPAPETVEAVQRHQARILQLALAAAESLRQTDIKRDFTPNEQVVTDRASWKFDSAQEAGRAVTENVLAPLREAERAMQKLYPADTKEPRPTSTALSIAIKMSEDSAKLIGLYPTAATREAHFTKLCAVLEYTVDAFAREQKLTDLSARKPITISAAELKALQSVQLAGPDATVDSINLRAEAIANAAEAPTMKASRMAVSTVREQQLRLLQRAHGTAIAMLEQLGDPNYRACAAVVVNRDYWKFDASSRTDLTDPAKLSPAEQEQRRSSNAARAMEVNIVTPLRAISREVYMLAPQNPERGAHPYASKSFESVVTRCRELHAELRAAASFDERKAVAGQLVTLLGASRQNFVTEHKMAGVDVNKPVPLTEQQLGQLQDAGFETRGITIKDATARNEEIMKVVRTARGRN